MHFDHLRLDHIGIRVTNLAIAEAFYAKLGFLRDPDLNVLEFNEILDQAVT